MKILFLSRWFPHPANNGSKLRIRNLLRGLNRRHDVTLLSFSDQPQGKVASSAATWSPCTGTHVIAWREFNPQSARAKAGFMNWKPRSLVDTFSPEMAGTISRLIGESQYDLVIASQLDMAAYYPYFGRLPAVFEELEIGLSLPTLNGSANWKSLIRSSLTWIKYREYLRRLLGAFRVVTVASTTEKELALRHFANLRNVVVIPNCLDMAEYQGIHVELQSNALVFAGSFRYRVNYEAMQWFVGNVFPLVLNKVPSARLIITGDHAGLPLSSYRNVTLAGHVDDVKSLIASSAVALAPLWSGGGTRLKILESLALGTPVVSTRKGAEGLDVVNGKTAMLSDDPVEFADMVVQLLENPALRQSLSAEGQNLVRQKYSVDVMSSTFDSLLQSNFSQTALRMR
ncbi:MAG: glycosyltransferase [Anaerolineales bacterium]|nr:glycosyltransferase [Anaerolineales bacterium]